MSDLIAFLRARLDEDEAVLRELTEIGERKRDAATEADYAANIPAFMELLADPAVQRIMQRQIALGYPAPNDVRRVLSELEAKRFIVAEYEQAESDYGEFDVIRVNHMRRVAKALARVYSGHPDYDGGWGL